MLAFHHNNPTTIRLAELAVELDTVRTRTAWLSWAVDLALRNAIGLLYTPDITPGPARPPRGEHVADTITRIRGELLRLLTFHETDIDVLAVGQAAGYLKTALDELATPRPA